MIRVKHYGVTIKVNVRESLNSCGVRQVEQFHVEKRQGQDCNITEAQANKLLKQLYREVRKQYKHVLVAGDAVGPHGWSTAGGQCSRTDLLSLAKFCEVNGWGVVTDNVNPNNDHLIKIYVDTYHSFNKGGGIKRGNLPPEQDFSDDEDAAVVATSNTNARELAEAIINFISE